MAMEVYFVLFIKQYFYIIWYDIPYVDIIIFLL